MDRAEAIRKIKYGLRMETSEGTPFGQLTVVRTDALKLALAALCEQEQREQGCEYCRGEEALYQHTNTTKLYINTFGRARTLVTECDYCPPYANCSAKNVPARSAFVVKYCPECGRRLED